MSPAAFSSLSTLLSERWSLGVPEPTIGEIGTVLLPLRADIVTAPAVEAAA